MEQNLAGEVLERNPMPLEMELLFCSVVSGLVSVITRKVFLEPDESDHDSDSDEADHETLDDETVNDAKRYVQSFGATLARVVSGWLSRDPDAEGQLRDFIEPCLEEVVGTVVTWKYKILADSLEEFNELTANSGATRRQVLDICLDEVESYLEPQLPRMQQLWNDYKLVLARDLMYLRYLEERGSIPGPLPLE